MIVAIVPAAGKGTRMKNEGENKVFIKLKDKPILFYTLKKLDLCALIDEIYLILDKESIEKKIKEIERFEIKKLKKIVEGGATRGESVYKGLRSIEKNIDFVVIHDGARPFVSSNKIAEVIEVAKSFDGAILGIPLSDTLKEMEDTGFIKNTAPRERYIRAQTPQVFKYSTILEVYKKLGETMRFLNTDESYLMEKAGYKIKVVRGEEKNIKITTPFDLTLAELIIEEERLWSI